VLFIQNWFNYEIDMFTNVVCDESRGSAHALTGNSNESRGSTHALTGNSNESQGSTHALTINSNESVNTTK